MNKEFDILANRFNYEPDVMLGCSQKEVMRTIVFALVPTTFLCGIVLLPLFGNFMYGFASGVIVGMGVFCLILLLLKRFRKGQEIGYLTQLLQRKLGKAGLAYREIFHRSGTWMIGQLL